MQLPQLASRLEPELVRQACARRGIELERLRLKSAAVQREHRVRLQALAQRVLSGKHAQLGQDLFVTADRQLRVHPRLERDMAQLLEALGLRARELFVRELAVGFAAPQTERPP